MGYTSLSEILALHMQNTRKVWNMMELAERGVCEVGKSARENSFV